MTFYIAYKTHKKGIWLFKPILLAAGIILLCLTTSVYVTQAASPLSELVASDLIVDVDWLKENIGNKDLVVVDTRDEAEYLEEHISGAVNIPVKSTFGKPPENDLIAPISHIQNVMSEAGIDNNTKVILYDDGDLIDAARVFWVLEVYGHKRAAILNGGFSIWREKGLSLSSEPTKLPKKTFLPTIVPNILSTKFSTRLAINDKSKTIIDARSAQEYLGQKSKTSRFGHIPSAINIPFYTNFDEKSGVKKLKTIESLEKNYQNVDRDKKVITYCNRGKESALTYFILRRLGFNVSAYDGSWLEWSSDNSLPVNIPDK